MKAALLAYPGHESLADPLRRALKAATVAFELRTFPDGETYLRIDSEVQHKTVVILCTLHEPATRVLPLLFMAETLRDLGARAVGLVAPYLAYMRQDRRFRAGEAITSSSFARLLSAQFDWLVTVDPHLHRRHSLGEIYSIPTDVVHAAPLLAEWIGKNVRTPLVVGPDAESEQWVRAVADAVPCPYVVLGKKRHGDRDVTVSAVPEIHRWANHTAVLVDDIISSAHTMSETVRQLRSAGLTPPVCLGVHGVFAAQAYETLAQAGAGRVVTTNAIAHASNDIDVSGLLVDPVQRHLTSATRRAVVSPGIDMTHGSGMSAPGKNAPDKARR